MAKKTIPRTAIRNLIYKIKKQGINRFVKRTNQSTKELNNVELIFNSSIISEVELSEKETELLEKESSIVTPYLEPQINSIINLMLNDIETRQSILSNMPQTTADVFPCLPIMHFLVINEQLNLTAFIRSNDIEKFLLVDLVYLNDLLKNISKAIKVPANLVTVYISSAHIYV